MSGSGTATDPYIVTTVTELQTLNDDKAAYYRLGNNIDASATSTWNSGKGFLPIGTGIGDVPFTGELDGDGYTISSLYINRPTTADDGDYVGLFGEIRGATIKNILMTSVICVSRYWP